MKCYVITILMRLKTQLGISINSYKFTISDINIKSNNLSIKVFIANYIIWVSIQMGIAKIFLIGVFYLKNSNNNLQSNRNCFFLSTFIIYEVNTFLYTEHFISTKSRRKLIEKT